MRRIHVFIVLSFAGFTASANMAEHAQRAQSAGIDLIAYHTDIKDVVVIEGSLPAGDAFAEAGNVAIATLTGMMLDRGTTTLDKFAIAQQLDDVGAQISFNVGTQTMEIRAKCLKKDLALVLGLIAAELRTPALLSQEFSKAKKQFTGMLRTSIENTDLRAHEAFSRAVYPDGHPNRAHSVAEYLAAAESATLAEVKAFHAKYYGPAHLTLILVGDVAMREAQDMVAKAFAGWAGGQDYVRPPKPAASPGSREVLVPLADKPSVSVILGQPTGLHYKDPDALPLRVGTAILGRGFTGRLMGTIRDKEGLTYSIGAAVTEDSIADGAWDISASFAPALLEKGIASTRRELQSWWNEGVTDTELKDHKEGIVGSYLVGLSTTTGLAGAILTTVQRGYDVTWLDAYPDRVKALTRDQVNTAIKTHLNPATMVLVKAGSLGKAPQ
jgi:zinc protease